MHDNYSGSEPEHDNPADYVKKNVRKHRAALDLEIEQLQVAIEALRKVAAKNKGYWETDEVIEWIREMGGKLEVRKTELAELRGQYPRQDEWA